MNDLIKRLEEMTVPSPAAGMKQAPDAKSGLQSGPDNTTGGGYDVPSPANGMKQTPDSKPGLKGAKGPKVRPMTYKMKGVGGGYSVPSPNPAVEGVDDGPDHVDEAFGNNVGGKPGHEGGAMAIHSYGMGNMGGAPDMETGTADMGSCTLYSFAAKGNWTCDSWKSKPNESYEGQTDAPGYKPAVSEKNCGGCKYFRARNAHKPLRK